MTERVGNGDFSPDVGGVWNEGKRGLMFACLHKLIISRNYH